MIYGNSSGADSIDSLATRDACGPTRGCVGGSNVMIDLFLIACSLSCSFFFDRDLGKILTPRLEMEVDV